MKYNAIVDFIKSEITSGYIPSGGKLPSIRDLCTRFRCTKGTAVRAYYELKEQGIIYAVPNSGYYLINNCNIIDNNDNMLDFSGTSLDKASLPYSEFQPCLTHAVSKYKEDLFSYGNPQGLDSLIDTLRKHFQDHQVFANNDRIFVTTGSQQALDILSKMPFPNGKKNAVIEQPTYQGMIQCLKLNNITAVGIERSFDGINLASLEKVFRNDNVKFFYTIPRFSNPLGLKYSNEDKKRILELAEKYDVYIIEDDYLGDLNTDKKSLPLYSYDTNDRVIYVKTFSKVLLPGLRVAAAILPKVLTNTFKEYKYWSDLNTPLISQGALELYISSGLFNIHIKKIKDLYFKRMAVLREITEGTNSSAIKWHVPADGCFYAGLEITNNSTAKSIIYELSKQNIILSDIESYYLKEFFNDKTLRISVANADCTTIKSGIRIIINEIERNIAGYKNKLYL